MNEEEINNLVKQNIKKYRLIKEYNLKQLAKLINISTNTMNQIENDNDYIIDIEILYKSQYTICLKAHKIIFSKLHLSNPSYFFNFISLIITNPTLKTIKIPAIIVIPVETFKTFSEFRFVSSSAETIITSLCSSWYFSNCF